MSQRFVFFYDILLEFQEPVRQHAFALRCIPPSFPGQKILEVSLTLSPYTTYVQQRDGFGILLQLGRLEEPHDHFRYTVQGAARLEPERRRPETCAPLFRYPSALTQPTPDMEAFLASLQLPDRPIERGVFLGSGGQKQTVYMRVAQQ